MRKKNSLGTRLLALLLSALLVLGAVPVNRASATENEAETIFSFEDAEPKEIQYKEGLEYTNCASGGEGNGAITYEILSGTEIATINSETGTLTISGPGTVTVQAKKAEDGEVPVQIAKYTLRIVQPEKEPFAFETKEPENLVYAEDLTYRNAASGGDGDGAVSYALLVMPTEEDEDEETEPEPLETDRNEVATIDTETGTVTILQAGSITVRAKKASDGDIPEQYAQYVLQIDLAEQTGFGFEDPAPDALEYKEGLTFTNTASGGEGTGAVTYAITEGDEVAEINSQTGELSIRRHGKVTVIATKASDVKYKKAIDTYTLEITKVTQTGFGFAIKAPDDLDYEENLTFTNTASGGEGTGEVTYAITDGKDVAEIDATTGTLSIQKYGTVTVTATKREDGTYAEARDAYTLVIHGWKQEPLIFQYPQPEVIAFTESGMTYSNQVSGGSGNGQVHFSLEKGSDIATIDSDGVLTITGMGTIVVVATKDRDNAYEPTSESYTLVVAAPQEDFGFQNTTPSIVYSPNRIYNQKPVGVKGNGKITYQIVRYESIESDNPVAEINSDTGELTIRECGEIEINAHIAANGEYAAADATYCLTVNKADQKGFGFPKETVEITYNDNGNQFPLDASGGESTNNTISYQIKPGSDQGVAEVTTKEDGEKILQIHRTGTVVVEATKSGDRHYHDAKATLTLTVKKSEQKNFGFPENNVEITYNDNGNQYLLNASGGESTNRTISYQIKPESDYGVAEVTTKEDGQAILQIHKAGKVIVEATKSGDGNYKEAKATLTLNVKKAQQTISFGQTKVTEIYGITSFQQAAIFGEYCSKNDAKYEIVGANTIGAKIDSKTGELSFGDSDGKVGAITVKVTKNGDECYETCSKEYVLELKYLATPTTPYTLSGEKINDSGWFTDDVTVTAPDGYLVSHTGNRITTSDWAQFIVCDNEGENKGYTIYLKNSETGRMTDGIAVEDLKIDKTKPDKLSISYDENVAWQDISETRYGFASKPVTVTFTANDEVSGIDVVAYSLDGGNTFAELQKEQGAYQITIAPQYRDQVVLMVRDHAGHTSDTLEDERDGRILVVDSIPPEIEAEFVGEYIYNEEDGWYYTSEDAFAISFTVTDQNYDLRETDPVIIVNDEVQKAVEWSFEETSGKAVLQLPDEGCYMVSVSFADRSGNEASYTASICVDRTKPERTVTFTSPSRVVDTKTMKDVDSSMVGDGVVAYYNTDAVVTLQIKEANFHPEDVALTMDGVDVPASGWKRSENDGDNVWRNELTLDQEGDHFIEMDYQDRAQNKMDSFQSHRIVIDKTAPIISIACENKDVKYTEEDRDYYAEKQTATITILEHNFRADDVVIHVTAKDAVGADLLPLNEAGFVESYANQGVDRSAWTPYVEGTWRNENDTYELSLVFDEDANYTFEIEYTDLATYQAQDSYAFTVDQTAPTNVKITYEEYDVGNTHYPQKYEDPQEGVAYAYYNDQVKVTVTAEDTVSGIRYFYYSYVNAPNVSSVNAELLDQRIDAERNGAEGTATFTIPREALAQDNQFNGTVTVVAENRTEKRTEDIDTQRIVVDNIRPTMTVTYNDPLRSVEGTDFYGGDITGTIDITEANFFSEDVIVTVTKDGSAYSTDVSWNENGADTYVGTFVLTEDGRYTVSVAYADRSGNAADTCTSRELVLDTTAPTDVMISYKEYSEGERHYPNKFEEILDKLVNVFYFNAAAEVTITATDTTAGMEYIALNVAQSGPEGTTSIKLPVDLVIGSDGTITGDQGEIKGIRVQYENGRMTVTCKIPEQYRGLLDILAVDMSKNETTYGDTTIVVVDTIAPERTVTFTPDRVVDCKTMKDAQTFAEGDEVVLYYNKDALATFKITEANFYAEDISVQVNGQDVSITDWTDVGNNTWTGTLTLAEEGDYVITVTYLDRACNEMIPYQSQKIIVDKTPPIITTKYSNTDVKATFDGRDYLDADQAITITIKERNFRADDVSVKVTAKNALGADVLKLNKDGSVVASYEEQGKDRGAWTAYKEGTWRSQNDTYELTLHFTDDANYTFDVEYTDLATNQAADYAETAFTVDKTTPTGLHISYSESLLETVLDAITFGFYNERVTVTISGMDETAGIQFFVYSYLRAPGVSSENTELVNQTVHPEINGKTGTATFTIPGDVLRNNNQFNGNVEFTAVDRSGNSAKLADSRRIVVDNISPTATVTYNDPVKTVEGVSYYNKDIRCSVEIVEANFYAGDVKVAVTKNGESYPVNVTWTRSSANKNIGTFTLKEDGEYIVTVEYTDKSGNQMAPYTSERHTLDTTHPTINVSNIRQNSANKDKEYGFVVNIHDINLDEESVIPSLTAVIKDENGIYAVRDVELGNPTIAEDGKRYIYTVENLMEDALYTLTCKAVDLAGNETVEILLEDEKAYEEVVFSINRNGSTFAYGNEFTENLVKQYYVYSVEEDVQIVEVNVDPIENYVIKLNGKQLTEGRDFTTMQTSKQGEWSKRMYFIRKDLFRAEGEYNIVVSTVDKAETTAFSDVKNLTVAFVVDQTKPVVTITGLETGGRYQSKEQLVTLIPSDEGGRLNSLYVVAFDSNGNPLRNQFGEDISVRFEMSGEAFLKYLEENDGKVTFTVPEGLNNQVQIVCTDCAVKSDHRTNEYHELFKRVTVSQNKLVIFYANKPVFFGSVAAAIGLIAVLVFVFLKRRSNHRTAR